jgi:ATP-dependent Lhr-like helicase
VTLSPLFHPAVAAWFARNFAAPTAAQAEAWPAIQAGRHVLIAAPTGSGKTLAAFLAAIDALVKQGLDAPLGDTTQIVYVSPLKALSNDIKKNLEAPLAGIREELRAQGLPDVAIRTLVRTGDTPQGEREQMRRAPPHILVTTPESLYILLGSESGRRALSTTRAVIIDEIHAVAPNKRGSHLAVSLERLQALCGGRLQRIGLSATQKPIEAVANFLIGAGSMPPPARRLHGELPSPLAGEGRGGGAVGSQCTVIDTGHRRARDLALEIPSSPLEAVMSIEVWQEVYDRLVQLIEAHRTTLIFVNTRRMAERATRALSERLGEAQVAAHHGSLAKERRLDAEQRLKAGKLKALVATASLELGIDRHLSAAGRPLGSCRRRHAEGPPLPIVARRTGRMRRALGQRQPRRARPPLAPRPAARCPGAADRRRGGDPGMERRRSVRAVPSRLAVSRTPARGFPRDRPHADRGLQHPARPARRSPAL